MPGGTRGRHREHGVTNISGTGRDVPGGLRLVPTRNGVHVHQHDAVLARLRTSPGATHDLQDITAAAIVSAATGGSLLLLGFMGGGVMAPLRALGWNRGVTALDLSSEAETLYREYVSSWAGDVSLERAEATGWLSGSRRRFDAILDDLSVPGAAGVEKPGISFRAVPAASHRRLRRGGVFLSNVIGDSRQERRDMIAGVAAVYARVLTVRPERFQNEILIAGSRIPPARVISARLDAALARIGSAMKGTVRVRTVR